MCPCQTMHNTRAGQFGHLGRPVQQGIQHGAMAVAAAGMHHQPNRLVDDHQHRIFEHHFKRNGLGRIGRRIRIRFNFDAY